MLRLTLQRKFFIALALLLALLLALFVGLSRFSLQRGIGLYVAEIELSRLDWMVANLQRVYARDWNWESIRANPRAWHEVQMPGGFVPVRGERPQPLPDGLRGGPGLRDGRPPPGSPGGVSPQLDALPDRFAPPPPSNRPGDPRATPDSIYNRLALVGADGTDLIAGNTALGPDSVRTPIQFDGRTVGYLALAPLRGLASTADRAFVAQQSAFVIYTGLAGLVLALLISVWMARRWLRPVEHLVGAARAVADGRFDVSVPVRGSDELADLSQTFNAMAAKLAAIEQSRQQWLADVAHELRTPVAAMRGEIEAVQDGVRGFDEATARRMHGQVMRLGKLVDDLRLVMQDAYPAGTLATSQARPLDVLLESVQSMRPRLEQRAIALEGLEDVQALATHAQPVVRGDDARLAQVFGNLLENSLRYTDAGGRLRLQAGIDETRRQLLITFEDSAPAPRNADLPRLFDRFFRGEASRHRALGGSGLGLAICKAIVEAHGGTIAASPSPLGGLRVTVALPVAAP